MLKKLKEHSHIVHKTGMFLSLLCLIHCLATPFLLTALPYMAQGWLSHQTEMMLVFGSIIIGFFILYKDFKTHENRLPIILLVLATVFQLISFGFFHKEYLTIIGSIILALAYILNWHFHRKICHSH